jgi:hypothetical protein
MPGWPALTRIANLYANVHVVGSNNNLRQNQEATLEFLERNKANIAWINEAYAIAKRDRDTGQRSSASGRTV